MVRKMIMIAALVTLPILSAQPAQAQNNTEFCREYTKDVSINGRLEKAYGKACRQPDGCLLYTSPSPRDQRGSRMPSSA